MADWKLKPITVLGLSRSGAAVARYVSQRGGSVFLSDTAPATPANESLRHELQALNVSVEMGGHGQACFTHSDTIVVSPGIPPSTDVMEQLRLSGKTILSEVEFAYRQSLDIHPVPQWVGITGTNGKSTTTTLVAWILSQAGFTAPACGNIGIPITDILNDAQQEKASMPHYLAAELSSFQLEFSPTLQPNVAILTNFKPDHLDWHGGLDAYREAKLKLFSGERSPAWSVLPADDEIGVQAAARTQGEVLWFSRHATSVVDRPHKIYLDEQGTFILEAKGEPVVPLFASNELAIIGDHNEENVLAAAAATWLLGVSPDVIIKACLSFQGLEHRLEKLAPVPSPTNGQNILFYNDSKATNTDAAISALKAFKTQKVILIAGGYDKMTALNDFVQEVQNHARSVILIGAAKDRFAKALAEEGFDAVTFAPTLEAAVSDALQMSQGEPVLFSPACSSFDMFRNFEERGRIFKEAVAALRDNNAAQALTATDHFFEIKGRG
jgi:UDP-N-acetylmuramoylalanine--D-glutamate ligase